MKTRRFVALVGMDFSTLADRALARAFDLAARHEHAEVHVLCVVPSASLGAHHALTGYGLTAEAAVRDGVFASLKSRVQTELDAFAARATSAPVFEQVASHVRVDTPALGIVAFAAAISANLIVLGTHGHRASNDSSLGSVAETTVRYAGCPVLLIPAHQEERTANSRLSSTALEWSSRNVSPFSASHRPSTQTEASMPSR